MTDDLRALVEKATPRLWVFRPAGKRTHSMLAMGGRILIFKNDPEEADAALIVAAVNALPGLLDKIDELQAALDAQAGIVCVGWEWLDTRDEMGWMRLNMSPESTPEPYAHMKCRRIYAGPVEGG